MLLEFHHFFSKLFFIFLISIFYCLGVFLEIVYTNLLTKYLVYFIILQKELYFPPLPLRDFT